MKNLFLISFAVILTLAACKKDKDVPKDNTPVVTLNPQQVQWGLVINHTATWCGSCGDWGAPLLHQLAVMGSGKVVAVAVHCSGDPMYSSSLYSSVSTDRATGGGIPSFWIGDEKVSLTSDMTNLLAKTPIAGMDMKTTKNAGNFSVKAQVKFFAAGQGDFYLSFFILEDGINGNSTSGEYAQVGTSETNYKHDFVLRAFNSNNFYGEKIATNPAANAVVDKDFTFNFNNTAWTNKVYVAAAIWHYNPNGDPYNYIPKYEYINGFVVK